MKKIILIGRFDDSAKEIENILSEQCQVLRCSDEEEIISGMLQSEIPDLIIIIFAGSSIAAREKFKFLMPFGIPILAIGSAADEAELFINGILSDDRNRFLCKPANIEDILRCVRELGISDKEQRSDVKQDKNRKTILLVDDSPEFIRIMAAMLSKRYNVLFATSGAQAIIAVDRNKPDLIMLDYEMPICNGSIVFQMIRSEKSMKDIPVIFLTGISGVEHVRKVVSLHPQGYLLKPCEEDTVIAMIDSVLCKK